MRNKWKFIRANMLLCIGLTLFVILVLIALFGQYLPFIDENLEKENHRMTDGVLQAPPYEPSSTYWMGTDHEGRDLFSLIVMGAKETLLIVLSITVLRYVISIPLSYLAHKKVLGVNLVVKSMNTFFSYIPTIIIVIMIAILPPLLWTDMRPYWLIFIVAMVEVGRVSNTLKEEFDALAVKGYMESGIAIGAGPVKMLKSYYLPFMYEKIIVFFVSDLGKVMFMLGQLGFIGIFISQVLVQVDPGIFAIENESISWPMLLSNAFMDIRGPIWIAFWPALAMTVTIFICNMIAEGLRGMTVKKDSLW